MQQGLIVWCASALPVLWILRWIYGYVKFHSTYRFPTHIPGRVPILGNMPQIPKHPADQRIHFANLAKEHGEMFTLKIGSQYWVFMNSLRVVNELLEKRGAIYVSRPKLPMAGDIISHGKRIIFMPFGPLWKWQRKVLHEILGPANKSTFGPFQEAESRTLLASYLDQPDKWHQSHARYSSSVVFSMTFGRRTTLNDPRVKKIVEINDALTQSFEPGSNLIDAFPFLGRIPFAKSLQPWRWWGDSLYEAALKNFGDEFDHFLERQKQGKVPSCFVSEFLRLGRDKEIDHDTMVFLAGSLIEAGSDTTRVSLNQLVAAAALFPEWVARARKDLDEVCGANAERLPNADDAPRLPYIKAAAKETVRWNPSFGEIAHSLIKDDEFEGYKFPAGTIFVWNHWGILNDPNLYAHPERFDPEHFLNEDVDKPTKGHIGFGAGRRVCPGWTVASASLFLGISRLIYCFDFHTVPGKPIPVGKPFSIGNEKPYEVKVTVRSQAHADLIRRECGSSESTELN